MKLQYILLPLAFISMNSMGQDDDNVFDNFISSQLNHKFYAENYRCAIEAGQRYQTILVSVVKKRPLTFNLTTHNDNNISATRNSNGDYHLSKMIGQYKQFRLMHYQSAIQGHPSYGGGRLAGMELKFIKEEGTFDFVTCYQIEKSQLGEMINTYSKSISSDNLKSTAPDTIHEGNHNGPESITPK